MSIDVGFSREWRVEMMLEKVARAFHGLYIFDALDGPKEGKKITFTRYEGLTEPRRCECEGCVKFRERAPAMREKLLAMTDAEFAVAHDVVFPPLRDDDE